jgi:two-component system, sensor histidine kinase
MALPDFFFERVIQDIRREMDGVLALAEQLRRHRLTADAEACVASVAEAAGGVSRVLACASDLRSVTLQGLTLNIAPVALRELMDEVQARWQPKAADAAVMLLVSYDGDPEAAVMADRTRLFQIFDGLIAEAVGGQSRGAVEVSLHAVGDAENITLQVRVRGARDQTWDALDVESRIKAIDERMGLEVAISAMLARRVLAGLGGELGREQNRGTSETTAFTLTLPAVKAEVAGHVPGAARAAHVLVVDDNATNRMVAQSLVEMFECTSESADDGVEAVEAVRSGRFDLILMDIRMPRMDGVAATRAIRALPGPVSGTPIIALTANADPEDAQAYIAAGMNGVVEKPMKPEHLLLALQQALEVGNPAAA